MYDIVVMGSINLDIIVECDDFPRSGDNSFCKSIRMAPGGKGNNQAVSAARFGKKVCFIGCVGDDAPGRQLRDNLRARHIDDSYLIVNQTQQTGSCVALLEASGDNTLLGNIGANFAFGEAEVASALSRIHAKILLIQMETSLESVLSAMRIAKERGMYVILDPAPVDGIHPAAFQYADLILPNSRETQHITDIEVTDEASALAAARKIHAMGVASVIVKMGGQGCLLYHNARSIYLPALPVDAVDTVGAGDCFAGALASHLIDNPGDIEQAIRFAQVVAGIKVSRFGGHDAIPALNEVNALLEEALV